MSAAVSHVLRQLAIADALEAASTRRYLRNKRKARARAVREGRAIPQGLRFPREGWWRSA